MAQNGLQLDLQKIPPQIHAGLEEYAGRVQACLKDNLQGITVVGSCLTGDFVSGVSDINTLLLVQEQHQGVLMGMAGLIKALRKERFSPPWVMTSDYVDRSRRVFGIEWLEFQWLHQTIVGPDPLTGLTFLKPDVRLQCERELKATLVRLRQGYVAVAGEKAAIRDILAAAAKSLMPTLRAMLWLVDLDRKPCRGPTCHDAWEAFGIDTQVLAAVGGWRRQDVKFSEQDVQSAFDAVYATVDQLAYFVDDLEV
jgi:ferredoxin